MTENTSIKIKKLNKTHQAHVLEILKQSNGYHHAKNPGYFAVPETKNQNGYIQWILTDRKNFGFVAFAGKKAVGLLFAGKIKKPNLMRKTDVYYVYDIAVAEEYKRQGIGRKLMDALTEKARKNKIGQIELNVYEFNGTAIAFYENTGWQTVSHTMILDL